MASPLILQALLVLGLRASGYTCPQAPNTFRGLGAQSWDEGPSFGLWVGRPWWSIEGLFRREKKQQSLCKSSISVQRVVSIFRATAEPSKPMSFKQDRRNVASNCLLRGIPTASLAPACPSARRRPLSWHRSADRGPKKHTNKRILTASFWNPPCLGTYTQNAGIVVFMWFLGPSYKRTL